TWSGWSRRSIRRRSRGSCAATWSRSAGTGSSTTATSTRCSSSRCRPPSSTCSPTASRRSSGARSGPGRTASAAPRAPVRAAAARRWREMVRESNRKYHDRVAGRYDDLYDTSYWRFYRDVSWRHLKPFIPERRPAFAADLGCGTGWFGTRLVEAGCHGTFLGPSGKKLGGAGPAVEPQGAAVL